MRIGVSTVSVVDDRVVDIGSRSLTCKSRENEGCLNVVGHSVVVVTHILLSCVFLCFHFRQETRCNVRQSVASCDKRVLNHYSPQVSTPLPDTIVIKMSHQVLKDSRKAPKSGAEAYAKVTCMCDETRHEAGNRADDSRYRSQLSGQSC